MADPGLKDAVWLMLEITAQQQPDPTIHSDFVLRKFPKVHGQELLNVIGELAREGKVTVKAASRDAHGNATAYHVQVRGEAGQPKSAPAPALQSAATDSGAITTGEAPVAKTGTESTLLGAGRVTAGNAQIEADVQFADQLASFFAQLQSRRAVDQEAKKDLTDELLVLTTMFQSSEVESFTTPIVKLAALKSKVHSVAPDLVPDYILLIQTALRAWLWRV